jgi:hypothetical protein
VQRAASECLQLCTEASKVPENVTFDPHPLASIMQPLCFRSAYVVPVYSVRFLFRSTSQVVQQTFLPHFVDEIIAASEDTSRTSNSIGFQISSLCAFDCTSRLNVTRFLPIGHSPSLSRMYKIQLYCKISTAPQAIVHPLHHTLLALTTIYNHYHFPCIWLVEGESSEQT